MIYSPRATPLVNKSHKIIHEVPKNNKFVFHVGEVSELWYKAMITNCHVFNWSNCSIVFV